MSDKYDIIVVGSGFAGSMTALNFLEQCVSDKKQGRLAILEVGKNRERCGASRWVRIVKLFRVKLAADFLQAMAYLRMDKNSNFDEDRAKEMELVSNDLAGQDYCRKLGQLVQGLAQYLLGHGAILNHHDEKNVLLEFKTGQHLVFPKVVETPLSPRFSNTFRHFPTAMSFGRQRQQSF